MASPRRARAGLLVLALALALAGLGALRLVRGRSGAAVAPPPPAVAVAPVAPPPQEPPAAPAPEAQVEGIRVLRVEGGVERRGTDARWTPVRPGESLATEEAIRTDAGGRAVLALGQSGQVEVFPRSEFSVREITRTLARVRLEQGRLSAAVPEGGAPLRVEGAGSEAQVESRGGQFVVLSTGRGQMAVAATAGTVRLSVGARSVVVHEGEQSQVAAGGAPAVPHAIPQTLYLKVRRPPAALQKEPVTVVRGRTAPGAIVSVNGVSLPADAEGDFAVTVPLKDGRNAVVVEAEDVTGKRQRVRLPSITVKSQVKPVRARVTWGAGEEAPR